MINEEMKNKDADDTNYLVARHGVSLIWDTDAIEEEIGIDFTTLEDNDWWIKWGTLFINTGEKIYQFKGEQDGDGFKRPDYGVQFNEVELDYAT